MQVEFTYRITGLTEAGWELLAAEVAKTGALNKRITSHEIMPPTDSDLSGGYIVLVSGGHDRSAITRQIVRPIITMFHRAKVATHQIQLTGTRILPTGRNATLAEGRTPQGTFTDPALGQMLADHGATLRGHSA